MIPLYLWTTISQIVTDLYWKRKKEVMKLIRFGHKVLKIVRLLTHRCFPINYLLLWMTWRHFSSCIEQLHLFLHLEEEVLHFVLSCVFDIIWTEEEPQTLSYSSILHTALSLQQGCCLSRVFNGMMRQMLGMRKHLLSQLFVISKYSAPCMKFVWKQGRACPGPAVTCTISKKEVTYFSDNLPYESILALNIILNRCTGKKKQNTSICLPFPNHLPAYSGTLATIMILQKYLKKHIFKHLVIISS